jgi:hypothetical protein
MSEFKSFILEHAVLLENYFNQTETLAIVILDNNLKISRSNECFRKLISSKKVLPGEEIYSFLLPESHELLPLSTSTSDRSVWLNFKPAGSSAIPLHCQIFRLENGNHLILGGHLTLTNEVIIQEMTLMSNEMANMARDLHRKNRELQDAHSKIRILGGIIPICMHCKEIRDDKGYWNQLEKFISEHSEALFSHCICEKCLKKHYPDEYAEMYPDKI